jgi:2-polyprenyl-3-methyl-5-hydroxy-6-metoxy-1,4-benzoquinol methylase
MQERPSRSAPTHVDVTPDTIKWLEERPSRYGVILLFDVLEHIPI